MFGMNFGKKIEKSSTKAEVSVENKESIESQIKQETVKFDSNLESLKAQIDGIGGVEALNRKIEKHGNESKNGLVIAGASGIGMLLAAACLGYMTLELPMGNFMPEARMVAGATATAAAGVLGVTGLGVGLKQAAEGWWLKLKGKNIKERAVSAGIA